MKSTEPANKTDLRVIPPIPWTLRWEDRATTLGGIVETTHHTKVATNVGDPPITDAPNRYSRAIPRMGAPARVPQILHVEEKLSRFSDLTSTISFRYPSRSC
ncbi:hypothetical protein RF11_14175 [Thelohanellus kitauei]|uniref:Uncharacterized protein n=1 Tax=Thelohanellus kitauei TaxID=669202 RepID=A0A0C2N7H2_THEKT|nr:hypothetical protein RF11_14175 [Thelohanellus kitauei]